MVTITRQAAAARLFDIWTRRLDDADKARQPYAEFWTIANELYLNTPVLEMPPGTEWMHATLLPEYFAATEGLTAQFALSIFDNPRSFSLETPFIEGRQTTQAVETLLRIQRRRSDFVPRSVFATRMGFIQGHIIQKNYYLRQYGEQWMPIWTDPQVGPDGQPTTPRLVGHEPVETLLFDGPTSNYPDLQNVWKSPALDWNGKPLWWIERIPYSAEEMERQDARYFEKTGEHLYFPDALRRLRGSFVSSGSGSAERSFHAPTSGAFGQVVGRRSTTSQASFLDDQTLVGSEGIWLWQCWGPVPDASQGGVTYDDTQYRVQLFTPDGDLLRDEPMVWNPYRDVFFLRIGQEPYGRTPMQWTINDIEQMSELRNLRVADVWMNILGGYIADRSVDWDQGDFVKMPGFIWFYDGDGRHPSQVLEQVRKQPTMPEAYHEVADAYNRVQRISGANQNTVGQAYGSRTTASEVVNIENKTSARIFLQSGLLAWQMEKQAMEDYFKLDHLFLENPVRIPLRTKDGLTVEITGADLDFDAEVLVDAHSFGNADASMLQVLQTTLGAFMADPEARMHLDIRDVMEEVLYRSGFPMDRVMRSEDEVQAQQQAMAQIAEAQMAAQGGQGAGEAGRQ